MAAEPDAARMMREGGSQESGSSALVLEALLSAADRRIARAVFRRDVIFKFLGKSREFDFVLPDQPEVSSRHITVGALLQAATVDGDPGVQEFEAFHVSDDAADAAAQH